MPDDLDQIAASSPKDKHVTGVGITFEPLLHQKGKTWHAAAHICQSGGDPDPNVGWKRDHRNAFKVAATRATGIPASMRTRTPRSKITSITAVDRVFALT